MRSSSHDSNEVCRLHCCHVKSLNKIETDFYSLMTCSLLFFFFFFFFCYLTQALKLFHCLIDWPYFGSGGYRFNAQLVHT